MLQANGTPERTDWQCVDWHRAEQVVRNLRGRIFKATREGNYRKVRSLQKLLLRSHANTLVSVRRVTQQNAGHKTPGVDKVVVKTPQARGKLVDELSKVQPWRASPTRRVYIPKANSKHRPLGIPTIRDRALQAKVKNALEPEWEALFEINSFGFRPGRSCQDAIEAIWLTASKGKKLWVVDADIEGAFDNISHDFLLERIHNFPARVLVKEWLKAGYMEDGITYNTPKGTPQGGVISPLLANIALHGMEQALGIQRHKEGNLKRHNPRMVVRYADDFVVLCETESDAQQAKSELHSWLNQRGLHLSKEKTRIVHLDEGFDFLGFSVRRYRIARKSSSRNHLDPNHKLLIKPSKDAVKRFKSKAKETFMVYKGAPPNVLIDRMNVLTTGWGNYYRSVVAKETFRKLDYHMLHRQIRWTKFRHKNKSWKWIRKHYFGSFAPNRKDVWVFGDLETGKYMRRLSWLKCERHVKVKGSSSPDDPNLRQYWTKRQGKLLNFIGWYKALAERQNYVCLVCKSPLANEEEIHLHHLITNRNNPQRELLEYQQLVHYFCHQQLHGTSGVMRRKQTSR